MTMTVQIKRGDNGPECVPLHTAAEGLAVTEPDPGEFTITHLASGFALWPSYHYERPRYFDAALRAWAVALEAGIDWTQDVEAIRAQIGSEYAWKRLRNRMRLAAFPPRRPRWHKGTRKRRLLPYEAASKREAIRSCLHSDILRDMWRDFWAYRRRSDGWGFVPEVVRQPCRRFGVTRAQREVQP